MGALNPSRRGRAHSTRSVMLAAGVAVIPASVLLWSGSAFALETIEELGKRVFFDTISKPANKQACASCHDPAKGWTLPNSKINQTTVSAPGARVKRRGSLKPPSSAYAFWSPPFTNTPSNPFTPVPFEGGNFWNGRAEGFGVEDAQGGIGDDDPVGTVPAITGLTTPTVTAKDFPSSVRATYEKYLGPTADQALGPFPNDVEQNTRVKNVCQNVKTATYSSLYTKAFGEPIKCDKGINPDNGYTNLETSYKRIAASLAAYQSTTEVNPFNAKRDKVIRGQATFTALEQRGHDLFYSLPSTFGGTGAGCAICHSGIAPAKVGERGKFGPAMSVFGIPGTGIDPNGNVERQTYADSAFHNIGLPFNREVVQTDENGKNGQPVPFGAVSGLNGHITNDATVTGGFQKTPTLRNVAKGATGSFTKAYMHNGYFKNLDDVVHFYNTRSDPRVPDCSTISGAPSNPTAKEAIANNCWPAPEFPANSAAPALLGNLGLSTTGFPDFAGAQSDEAALVAYLKTLSDNP